MALLALRRDRGQAERDAGGFERLDVVHVGQVEVDLAIKPSERRIQELGVSPAELTEAGEHVGVQFGDELQDPALDLAVVGVLEKSRAVALGGVLAKPREGRPHLLGEIGLLREPVHRNLQTLGADGVADLAELGGQLLDLGFQLDELVRATVGHGERAQPP